MTEKMCSCC